jgi:hypothetical protein
MNQIWWLDSQIMRALLVAAAGVIGVVLSFFGVDEALFTERAARLIDALSLLLTAGGVAWAAYARAKLPTPPISDKAVQRTVEREQQEKTE